VDEAGRGGGGAGLVEAGLDLLWAGVVVQLSAVRSQSVKKRR